MTKSKEYTRSSRDDGDDNTNNNASNNGNAKKYKGIRCRKWGKWVSEVRLPKTRSRLWLGTYFSQEAAAMAHDTAVFCLRGMSATDKLNFPECIPTFLPSNLSPRSIQKAALDAGAAIDAGLVSGLPESDPQVVEMIEIQDVERSIWEDGDYNDSKVYQAGKMEEGLSLDDMDMYM